MNFNSGEQEEVDGMKKGADSTGAYLKERLVICNEENTDVEQGWQRMRNGFYM